MDPEDLEDQLHLHDSRVKQHGVNHAEEDLRRRKPTDADQIITTYRERIGLPLQSRRGLLAPGHQGWYLPKPDHDSPRWAHAKNQLRLPPDVVERTSDVSDEILARLSDPQGETITTRGLVLGHVQSGKTTSYLAVAAKAADNGFDLIIILAGVHNSLRRQTQNRSARTLVHKSDLWWLGTAVGDFKPDGNSLSSHLAGNGKRGLLVVKKHATILERLADWLEKENDASKRRLAILVIDDEADQAGLDVSQGGELEGVHKQLSRIVNLRTSTDERRCAYLAYTATPYANILTSQNEYGLYPRDFIYPLETPTNYVGSEELFGRKQIGQPVRIEDEAEDGILSQGLRDAVTWFVLATAARIALGSPIETFHSSMLIHTTQKTADQLDYQPAIEQLLKDLRATVSRDPGALREYYQRTLSQVPASEGGGPNVVEERTAAWPEVEPHIHTVLRRLIDRTPAGEEFIEDGRRQRAHSGVIVDNSIVPWVDRLTYSDREAQQPSVTVIAVGGNTLSRGLTLEGLVCSYFARTARNYDSLMQMGRWYGYRSGYRHLLRVWTTQGLFDWFRELDQVEQDLRDELVWMQDKGLTPNEYGPRIRVSPNMNITRAAAMRSVSRHVSYSDSLLDPAWLNLDPAALGTNQQLVRELAAGLGDPAAGLRPSLLFRDVPLSRITDLLYSFEFHPEEKRIDLPSLRRYIEAEAGHLHRWNVVFKSVSKGTSAPFDFRGDVGVVSTINRARVKDASIAYIQSLVDSEDHRLDFGGDKPENGARYRSRDEPPLLVVYAVDPQSQPQREGRRAPLNAGSTPISISICLPESNSKVDYVTPALAASDALDMGDYQDV